MSKLTFSRKFTTGAGVGQSDIAADAFHVLEIADETSKKQSPLFVIPTGSGEIQYQSVTELYVNPGYFYIGDREFYVFGDKGTQFSRPEVVNGVPVIKLYNFPDGPVGSDVTGDVEPISQCRPPIDGASPIIIRRYPFGFLEDFRVPSGVVISSEDGFSGCIGYTLDVNHSGAVSGEVANWPWFQSPLSRFAKTYEYWRPTSATFSGEILSPDEYFYDFDQNQIILPSGIVLGDYVIEMELMNEPFPIGIDFSPLDMIPEDLFVCISLSGDLDQETLGSVTARAGRTRARGETIPVSAELISDIGNRMEGTPITFWMERTTLQLDGVPVSGIPEYYEPVSISGDLLYDIISLPSGVVSENGIIVANDHRIDGKVMLQSAGYLLGDTPSASVVSVSNAHGFATCSMVAPAHIPYPIGVTICAGSGAVTDTVPILLCTSGDVGTYVPSGVLDVYNLRGFNPASDVEYNSIPFADPSTWYWYLGAGASGNVMVLVPSGCISPTSIELYECPYWHQCLYEGVTPVASKPLGIIRYHDNWLMAIFNMSVSVFEFSVKYPQAVSPAYVDGRTIYG